MNEFFAMGGYGLYVWPAYGITLLVLALIWLDGTRRRRAVERDLQRLSRDNAANAAGGAAS
jgi:heme exporter protein D